MNDSKEHIINTSLKLFLQKNFKEVTMKEILDQSGLSKGAFYHYFKSKEEVFEAVINLLFSEVVNENFQNYSKDSLKEFYNDCVNDHEQQMKKMKQLGLEKDAAKSMNQYFLLFDAFKLLPGFRDKHIENNAAELKAWTKIITYAQKNGEIRNDLSAGKIAKLFMYLGDGIGLQSIMLNEVEKAVKETKSAWDTLYESIRLS